MGSSQSMDHCAPSNTDEQYSTYSTGQNFVTESDAKVEINFAEKGVASVDKTPAMTFPEVFEMAVKRAGKRVVLRTEGMPNIKKGDKVPPPLPANQWKSWTMKEYHRDCRRAGKGVIALGMEAHDAVNIFGFNSPEWFIGQFAAIFAGGKAAGIYPSDTPEQVQFKSNHSNGSIAFVETEENLAKFVSVADDLPYLKAIVCWACDAGDDIKRSDGTSIATLTFEQLLELGDKEEDAELDKRIAAQEPGHCCALIYTSGTTGNPKAVMISHDNLIFESRVVMKTLNMIGESAKEERLISYLPLSHVAGMMVDIICPIVLPAFKKGWFCVSFARPYDIKMSTIGDRLKSVRPTIFLGVPRVWEKISEKLKALGATTKGIKKKLSTAAKKRGLIYQSNRQLSGSAKTPSGYGFYNKVVLKKIKAALGLNECKFAFTGAAPISKDTLEYFGSLGININEVYGMSECTGATTWSTDMHHTWGSVGYELEGMEVKVFKVNPSDINDKTECPVADNIFTATEEEQGEICFRGRHIMMGYMANPRLGDSHVATITKKNKEAVDEEGWLHSGDKGVKGKGGMIKITGRYKELIITAGGENVAPVPIEDAIKALLPAVSNVMMVGDKRKFNVCIISLKAVGATGELPGGNDLDKPALEVSEDSKTISDAMADAKWSEYIEEGIKKANALAVSNAAKIQKFTILPIDFSVETGELTATLKLKRSVVQAQYSDVIEKMYNSSEVYVPFN